MYLVIHVQGMHHKIETISELKWYINTDSICVKWCDLQENTCMAPEWFVSFFDITVIKTLVVMEQGNSPKTRIPLP